MVHIHKKDNFKRSGPKDVSDSWWSRDGSLRRALACFVQAVYVFARYPEDNTCAQDWYRPFNYELVKTIWDGVVIVGAIFRWSDKKLLPDIAPRVVIAFRGTMWDSKNLKSDVKADVKAVMLLEQDDPSRIKVAVGVIQEMISEYSVKDVCITGHSLGAAVCLRAERQLAKQGCFVEAHLFNPPFPALRSTHEVLNWIHDLILAELSSLLHVDEMAKLISDNFEKLNNWKPHLYVNRHDRICSSYVAYFKHQLHKKESGKCNPLASFHSIGTVVLQSLRREAEPFHLIPSATVHVLEKWHLDPRRVHGISQWWAEDKPDTQTNQVQFMELFLTFPSPS